VEQDGLANHNRSPKYKKKRKEKENNKNKHNINYIRNIDFISPNTGVFNYSSTPKFL